MRVPSSPERDRFETTGSACCSGTTPQYASENCDPATLCRYLSAAKVDKYCPPCFSVRRYLLGLHDYMRDEQLDPPSPHARDRLRIYGRHRGCRQTLQDGQLIRPTRAIATQVTTPLPCLARRRVRELGSVGSAALLAYFHQ